MRRYAVVVCLGSLLGAGCAAQQSLDIDLLQPARLSQFAPSAQGHASIVADTQDRMLVVWDSRRQQGGKYGVLGRFINADGTMASDEFTINTHVLEHQMHPASAMADDGSAWVAWTSWLQDGDQGSIVARHFNGIAWEDEVGVNVTQQGHQVEPVVAMHADGGALVLWISNHAGTGQVMARRVRPCGSPGQEFTLSSSGYVASVPGVAPLGDGWVATWALRDTDGALSIQAAMLAGDGTPVVASMQLASDAIEPVVASNGEQAAAAWLARDVHGWRVEVKRFAQPQTPSSREPQTVAQSTPGHWITGVAMDVGDDGDIAVAWSIDKPVHDTMTRTIDRHGYMHAATRLAHGGHLEAVRATGRLHIAGNGSLHAALSGKAGGDKKAAMLASTATAGDAKWGMMDLPEADMTYGLVHADVPIPPVFDPNFVAQRRSRTARPQRGDIGFEGITYAGWTPPDPDLAAGPTHVVQVTNGEIAFFTHGGQLVFQDEIEDSFGFWGSVGATSFVFDPEVLYDQRSNRFFAMANERSDNGGSYFLLAVSDDSNPEGTWHKYRLDMSHVDNDIDSPNMAVDEDTVYLACDMFGGDKYAILMVPKAQVLAGQSVSGTTELLLTGSGNQSLGLPRSTDDEPNVPQFMLQSSEGTNNGVSFSEIRIHAILDPLGDPYRETYDLPVATYQYPSQVPQQGTSIQHYLFEPRFWSCAYRNGSVWAVHHVNGSRARVRWYEIDMHGWPLSGQTPVVAQSGELDQGFGIYTFFPAIAVDAADNVAIVFARGASNEYTSMWRAVRSPNDASGTFQPPALVKGSTAPDTSGRWGDYSGASPDPSGGAIWLAHEWRPNSGWSTWIDRASIAPNEPVHVPGDYATIQAAIDDVTDGTTIEVAAGTYAEHLNLNGRSLSLLGAGAELTVLDAGGTGLAIDLDNAMSGMLIDGFAITNGNADWGGGVFVRGAPTIRNCSITYCSADVGGGMLSLLSPGPVIQDCLFCSNTSHDINGPWQDAGGNVFEITCPGDCAGDVTGDGVVGVEDVLLVLADFGGSGAGDANDDGVVDVSDLLLVIGDWGAC